MSLYDDWLKLAYDQNGRAVNSLWKKYLPLETEVYKNLLSTKTNKITGTTSELGVRFNMPDEYVCGFIDGINGALKEECDVKELTNETLLELEFTFEDLYKKMVEYKAEHLYSLSEWDELFDAEARKKMYREQKSSKTIVKEHEPGRNELCPCGSGKKYKKCCGMM